MLSQWNFLQTLQNRCIICAEIMSSRSNTLRINRSTPSLMRRCSNDARFRSSSSSNYYVSSSSSSSNFRFFSSNYCLSSSSFSSSYYRFSTRHYSTKTHCSFSSSSSSSSRHYSTQAPPNEGEDHYAVLNVARTATTAEIRTAFLEEAKKVKTVRNRRSVEPTLGLCPVRGYVCLTVFVWLTTSG